MPDLVNRLQRFNRKERYWLLHDALGAGFKSLSNEFRSKIAGAISTPARSVTIPPDAWWSFDYHIDWLYGALWECSPLSDNSLPSSNLTGAITGTQEDFDLLIAFESTLVIVEAKGVSAWGNGQFGKKCKRLTALRTLAELAEPRVEMFFVLASPSEPTKLNQAELPAWALNGEGRPIHIKLPMPPPLGGFRTVGRCNENGTRTAKGEMWNIRAVSQRRR